MGKNHRNNRYFDDEREGLKGRREEKDKYTKYKDYYYNELEEDDLDFEIDDEDDLDNTHFDD